MVEKELYITPNVDYLDIDMESVICESVGGGGEEPE